jgi:hypothetical protein
VASHFECLGFSFDGGATFEDVMIDLLSGGDAVRRSDGGQMLVWTDPSGARVVGNSNDRNELDCVLPTLVMTPRLRVKPTGWLEDPQCRFCDSLHVEVVDDQGEMCYPLAFQIDDIGVSRSQLSLGSAQDAAIAGFAESVEVWEDEDAYTAARTADVPLGVESLIPVGLFASEDEAPTPHALITGRVLESETRTNEKTGTPFIWALVKTFGGDYETVLSSADAGALHSGTIIQGQFWLVGHVGGGRGLDGARRRGLRGLFGR